MAVRRRNLSRVIAMISVDVPPEIADLRVFQQHSCGDIRIDMPSQQHVFIKAVIFKQIATQQQLKIPGAIVANEFRSKNDFVEI